MRFYALALNLLTVSISVCAVPASTLSSKQFALFRSMLRHRDGNKLLKVAIAAPHITARLTPIHYNQPVQAKPKPVKLKQVHNVNINMHANLEIVDERLNMRQLLSYQILRNHEKLTNKFHQSGTLHTDRWRIGCEQFQEVPPSETLRQTYVASVEMLNASPLWSWAKPTMGLSWLVATSHTLHHCRRQSTRVSDCSLVARLSTAIGPLLVETGIGSLLTRSLVSRVRLLERSVTKRTPINAICSGTDNDVFTLNVQGAVGKIPALVLVSSDQTAIHEQILADTTSQTKDSQATALVCIDGDSTNMWRLCITPKQLLSTSIAHLVVECEQVTGHRIQSGLVPAIQKSRLRLLGRALDPGVENVYTWLRGGVLNGKADLDQRWLHGTVEHESMGTRHDNRALAARLADFLQVTYRQYQTTLWKYHQGSHCGSWLN
ncbi:hypothetical protein BASA61_006578 [Batrachochytrium salamandrivorans]|nr:hypothetical protein BASA61_006578 [Batrachochytrium salamandrivorans]